MRGELRNHSTCTPCITQRDYTHRHNEVTKLSLKNWASNVDCQKENQHIVINMWFNSVAELLH